LYLYLLPDIPDSTLSKFIPDDIERGKLLDLAKEANKATNEGEERAMRKRQHLKAQDEVRQRESDMRKSLRESLMRSRSTAINKHEEPKNDFEIDPGDLEFVKSLGSGTSGEVFKGLYLAKAVAVKVLKSSNTPKEKDEFIAEFKIIASLDSSYIVHFFGAVVKEKLALVMEFCDRGSLYNVLQDEDVDIGWKLSFDMLEEVVKGIQVLHTHNPPIMHRDLKTLNVLVTHDFHCKLCDFGLARFDTASNLGTLQNCRGTYAYIAPEVYEGKKFTLFADIYAVSIMTWEFAVRCMKGKYETPYKEFPFIKMEFQIIVQASMKNLRPTIPPKFPFPKLISDVWAKEPASRPLSDDLLKRFAEVKKDYEAKKGDWDALVVKQSKPSKEKEEKKE
jgi:serine/threonine protein kinase